MLFRSVTGTLQTPLGDLPVTGTMAGSALTLKFSAHCPAFPSFEAVYAKLAPS